MLNVQEVEYRWVIVLVNFLEEHAIPTQLV